MNYTLSKEMLRNAENLIDKYTLEQNDKTILEKIKHRKRNVETLKQVSFALGGLMSFMTDYDKSLLANKISENKLNNKLVKAIELCKKEKDTWAIA